MKQFFALADCTKCAQEEPNCMCYGLYPCPGFISQEVLYEETGMVSISNPYFLIDLMEPDPETILLSGPVKIYQPGDPDFEELKKQYESEAQHG